MDFRGFDYPTAEKLLLIILKNPPKKDLESVKFFFKGSLEYLINFNPVHSQSKNSYLNIKKIVFDLGYQFQPEPNTLVIFKKDSFNWINGLEMKDFYISTKECYHQNLSQLITFLMENFPPEELKNFNFHRKKEGINALNLNLNLKNSIENNFNLFIHPK